MWYYYHAYKLANYVIIHTVKPRADILIDKMFVCFKQRPTVNTTCRYTMSRSMVFICKMFISILFRFQNVKFF